MKQPYFAGTELNLLDRILCKKLHPLWDCRRSSVLLAAWEPAEKTPGPVALFAGFIFFGRQIAPFTPTIQTSLVWVCIPESQSRQTKLW